MLNIQMPFLDPLPHITSFTHITIQLVLCVKKLAAVEEDFLDGICISAAHPQYLKARQTEG